LVFDPQVEDFPITRRLLNAIFENTKNNLSDIFACGGNDRLGRFYQYDDIGKFR
jgi:hypothetical protein